MKSYFIAALCGALSLGLAACQTIQDDLSAFGSGISSALSSAGLAIENAFTTTEANAPAAVTAACKALPAAEAAFETWANGKDKTKTAIQDALDDEADLIAAAAPICANPSSLSDPVASLTTLAVAFADFTATAAAAQKGNQ